MTMIDVLVPVSIALASGAGVLTSRINSRINDMDRRIDGLELRMAETYVTKGDFQHALERVENQMIRIEEKLDTIAKIAMRAKSE